MQLLPIKYALCQYKPFVFCRILFSIIHIPVVGKYLYDGCNHVRFATSRAKSVIFSSRNSFSHACISEDIHSGDRTTMVVTQLTLFLKS